MANYIVKHVDGTESQIDAVAQARQVYGFLEFRDEDGDLIVALRVESIKYYTPQEHKRPKSTPAFRQEARNGGTD